MSIVGMEEILAEREKQDQKWGEQNHDTQMWVAILMKEVGEVRKAICEEDTDSYRKELVHVAAVALAALQSHERQETNDEMGT